METDGERMSEKVRCDETSGQIEIEWENDG